MLVLKLSGHLIITFLEYRIVFKTLDPTIRIKGAEFPLRNKEKRLLHSIVQKEYSIVEHK
jgi:hypothetical protein